MVNLNILTIVKLKELAGSNNISIKSTRKADIIEEIQTSKIPKKIISDFIENYKHEKKQSRKTKKKTKKKIKSTERKVTSKNNHLVKDNSQDSSFNVRISLIEDQIRFILKKLDNLENKIVNNNQKTYIKDFSYESEKIKNIILQILNKYNSISIDKLKELNSLNKYDWNLIENSILTLIDEEKIDVSEGNSKKKIDGYIGRLIKR